MSLKVGIVGLPNVGKSTLFNAITNSNVEAANYPFSTINPNIGVVEVPDERMVKLAEIFFPQKIVYNTFEFTDIAGLIAGASKGEGLGNAFLANIRETDAICQVIRCFDNNDIIHVEGSVNPIRDIEIINLELIISDQDMIKKRIDKIGKKALNTKETAEVKEYQLLLKLQQQLNENKLLKDMNLNDAEKQILKNFNLLTIKPFIFVANVSEQELANNKTNKYIEQLKAYADNQAIDVVVICAKVEQELSQLEKEEKQLFMNEYNIDESGLDQLIKKSYRLLKLATFFTAGKQEVRAWTFENGYYAPECAGVIHSDFQKGFIRAEVYNYNDLIEFPNEKILKEKGKIRSEGKTYLMQDGDVCFFKFNV